MKITYLGTAAGVPEKNRATASSVIEAGGRLYLIDAGMGGVNSLIDFGFDLEAVRAVFITHAHGDHLWGLLDLMRCVSIEKIYPTANIDYYMPEEATVAALDRFCSGVSSPIRYTQNRFHIINEGVIFDDGVLRVSAVPTAHTASVGKPSYAFLVEAEGKRVVFSGDLSGHLEASDVPSAVYLDEVELLTLELAHFSLDDLRPHLNGMKAKRIVFNHISDFEKKLPLIEEFIKECKDIEVSYSYDGYSVTI